MHNNGGLIVPARQITWHYWNITENNLDTEFYAALQSLVATAIPKQLSKTMTQRVWVGREMQVDLGSYKLRARLTKIDPPLADGFDQSTAFLAQYRERPKEDRQDISTFIAEIIRYPNEYQDSVYRGLVGLDEIKEELKLKLRILLTPQIIESWAQHYYPKTSLELLESLRDRYPLIVLEGEVGSGKTALARSIGHTLAESLRTQVALFVVNAQVRGGGHVGELTQNISRAFDEAERYQEQEQIPVMMLIDEADALARIRGTQHTHHEDDAGVNTLIQRIDRLRGRPIVVIFSTNLALQLDAAILRRATASFHFARPNFAQRVELFRSLLKATGVQEANLVNLASLTNPRECSEYDGLFHCYTYSDISQRIIPHAVEQAIAGRRALSFQDLKNACQKIIPTRESSLAYAPDVLEDWLESYFEPGYAFSIHLPRQTEDTDKEPHLS